jgi:hypothetical protein
MPKFVFGLGLVDPPHTTLTLSNHNKKFSFTYKDIPPENPFEMRKIAQRAESLSDHEQSDHEQSENENEQLSDRDEPDHSDLQIVSKSIDKQLAEIKVPSPPKTASLEEEAARVKLVAQNEALIEELAKKTAEGDALQKKVDEGLVEIKALKDAVGEKEAAIQQLLTELESRKKAYPCVFSYLYYNL